MSNWGHFALWLAWACCVLQVVASVTALRTPLHLNKGSTQLAQRALSVHTALIILACCGLVHAFIKNDFSLLTVAHHSHVDLPLYYKVTALWAGHEGSILLWLSVASVYALFCSHSIRNHTEHTSTPFYIWVVLLFGLIQFSFLCFCLFTSNPFTPSPTQDGLPYTLFGASLNPILQDPLMAIHPPILYSGYVGCVAPCVLVLAYLMTLKTRNASHTAKPYVFTQVKRWTLIAWSFLTLGIGLGSFWAYYELGWGGFWFWDPVENASLMPWLLMVASIHALNASIKHQRFYTWSAGLAIACFCMTLIGTFTVRSGLLSSVHSFSNDPSRGVVLLSIIALFCTVSVAVFLYNLDALTPSKKTPSHPKRAHVLFFNTLIFISACFTVAVGTLTPIFYDVFLNQTVTIGAPYFNAFAPYFLLAILFGMVLSAVQRHHAKHTTPLNYVHTILLFFISLVCVCAFTKWQYDQNSLWANALTSLLLCAFIMHTLPALFVRGKASHPNLIAIFKKAPMHLAHAGFMVMCVGIIISTAYGERSHQKMTQNTPFDVSGQTFVWRDTQHLQDSAKQPRHQLQIDWVQANKPNITLTPEKRFFPTHNTVTSEVALHSQWGKDIYIVLGERIAPNTWIVNVQYKPMIRYLWVGVLMMALAGLLAVVTGRATPSTKQAK